MLTSHHRVPVPSQVSACCICCGQSGTRASISSSIQVFPLSVIIPPILHTHPSYSVGTVGLFEAHFKGTQSHLTHKMMMLDISRLRGIWNKDLKVVMYGICQNKVINPKHTLFYGTYQVVVCDPWHEQLKGFQDS
jgi:hypothetical protein